MKRAASIPGGVWALGFVSMFMDVSSEAIHSLLPIFLVSVLSASATAVGVLEGIAEASVLVTKMFSGALSDWMGKRKGLALLGYGMAAVTKPLFAIAGSFSLVFAARMLDRIGKGIRGAPRDAMVADLVTKELRGASYGLRQTLDTIGALAGPLLAAVLMLSTGGNFRLVFWIAVIPALISLVILERFVVEPIQVRSGDTAGAVYDRAPAAGAAKEPVLTRWNRIREFPKSFWSIVLVGSIFTLARFSEAFLVLRASDIGIAAAFVPLTLVVLNAVYALSAYPAGWLSDRLDRRVVVAIGAAVLLTADLVLARAAGVAGFALGIALWGLHMGLTQGVLAALIADTAPAHLRGTAFGLFSLASGLALLAASVAAGLVWDQAGPAATFYLGSIFAAAALAGLILLTRTPASEVHHST